MILLCRRYIVSHEISVRWRRHGRPLLECPSDSWYMHASMTSSTVPKRLPSEISLGKPSQDCRAAELSSEPLNEPEIVSRTRRCGLAHRRGATSDCPRFQIGRDEVFFFSISSELGVNCSGANSRWTKTLISKNTMTVVLIFDLLILAFIGRVPAGHIADLSNYQLTNRSDRNATNSYLKIKSLTLIFGQTLAYYVINIAYVCSFVKRAIFHTLLKLRFY